LLVPEACCCIIESHPGRRRGTAASHPTARANKTLQNLKIDIGEVFL
jgi:hypothetical protein